MADDSGSNWDWLTSGTDQTAFTNPLQPTTPTTDGTGQNWFNPTSIDLGNSSGTSPQNGNQPDWLTQLLKGVGSTGGASNGTNGMPDWLTALIGIGTKYQSGQDAKKNQQDIINNSLANAKLQDPFMNERPHYQDLLRGYVDSATNGTNPMYQARTKAIQGLSDLTDSFKNTKF